jgi:hypothetical protein
MYPSCHSDGDRRIASTSRAAVSEDIIESVPGPDQDAPREAFQNHQQRSDYAKTSDSEDILCRLQSHASWRPYALFL